MKEILSIKGINLSCNIKNLNNKREYSVMLNGDLRHLQAHVPMRSRLEGGTHLPEVILIIVYDPSYQGRITIFDITGNPEGSGFEGIGIGTLLFNTALQLLFKDCLPDTYITGELTTVDDPKNDPAVADKCKQRRARFWSSFGFKIDHPNDPWSTFSANLKDLHTKEQDIRIQGIFPRFVKLSAT